MNNRHVKTVFSILAAAGLLTLVNSQAVNAQQPPCFEQTFSASKSFSGVRSCGDRGRQEDEARAACNAKARNDFGQKPSITLVTDPPQFTADADQRDSVCAKRIANACVDFKDECSGRVDATCVVKVCF